jgi:hypothetical protein
MAQQQKESFSHSDCEKELIRYGEDPARAAEICKGKEESEGQTGGRGSSTGEEGIPEE